MFYKNFSLKLGVDPGKVKSYSQNILAPKRALKVKIC